MVKHIVLWKIRDDAEKQANMDRMIDMLTSLVGKIDGLVSIEMGYNFNDGSDYDVVLYASFKNTAALKYYQNHPEHVKCKDFIGTITTARTSADYFFEEASITAKPFNEVPDAPEEIPAPKAVQPEISVEKIAETKTTEIEVTKPDPIASKPDTESKTDFNPVFPTYEEPKKDKSDFSPFFNRSFDTDEQLSDSADLKDEPVPDNSPFYTDPGTADPFSSEPINETPSFTNNIETAVQEEPVPPQETPEEMPTFFSSEPQPTFEPEPQPTFQPEPQPTFEPEPQPTFQLEPQSTFEPEPQPMQFTPAPKADSKPNATVKEKTNIFGKKKLEVDVTPLEQRSDTWTCPNCGKVMPNYVGTCGCGEVKPFDFEAPVPSSEPKPAPVKPAAPAPSAPKSNNKPNATVKEKTNVFGKKKLEVDVTPLEQRSDTWTCPNCGKVMPNYVGTCGCGEVKPFDFEAPVPSSEPKPAPVKPAAPAPSAPKSNNKPNATVKEKTNIFGKKKLEVDVTPLEQRSDTWTCPNCGKVMPNYVGTCGCGEVKPFDFPENDSYEEPLPSITAEKKKAQGFSSEELRQFDNVEPSLQSYNPQVQSNAPQSQSDFGFIKNDQTTTAAPMTFNSSSDNGFGFNFEDVPPASPMKFNDAPPESMGINHSDAQPMRFNDTPEPQPMRFNDTPEPQPMRFSDTPSEAQPMRFNDFSQPVQSASNTPVNNKPQKPEKKHHFGKKAKEEEAMRKAQEAVNNRKDVPNNGTWTCPNCGKVMPKYVGTCGCGEPQPFEF